MAISRSDTREAIEQVLCSEPDCSRVSVAASGVETCKTCMDDEEGDGIGA